MRTMKVFLQSYLDKPQFKEDADDQCVAAWVDLNKDGKSEAIVYVTGHAWCGSGGCITIVLRPERTSYRAVTKTTITRPPIRVMGEKSHGWHDISVTVQGGGILKPHEARMRFDGAAYPSNPTVPPAQSLKGVAQGPVVIDAAVTSAKSLYR